MRKVSRKSLFRSCHNYPTGWKCHPRAAAGWQLGEKENGREKRWQGIAWRRNIYGHTTLNMLDLIWMKEKWEGEVYHRAPINNGLFFLQGEKEKQLASTVLIKSHPLYHFQAPLFIVWSPFPIASNLTIYPLISKTHSLISTSQPTPFSSYVHSKIH